MTGTEQRVLAYLEEHREELFAALSRLVQIDTQNFKTYGNENAGQAYFETLCRESGLQVDRYAIASVEGITAHPQFQAGRDAEHRDNVVAILRGTQDVGGVMLAGHMDTMPCGDPGEWKDDPLSGCIRDGYIYGRGVGDDKYGIILPWFIFKAFRELGICPTKNLLIGSYADEEYGGCNGPLALCLKHPCEAYINLDGTGLEVEALGGACYRIEVTSHAVSTGVASVFDVFGGVRMVIEALLKLHQREGTAVRLSSFEGGQGGEKKAIVRFAIYTDMTESETAEELHKLYEAIQPQLKAEQLSCTEFCRTTRFFGYGKAPADSGIVSAMAEAEREIKGDACFVPAHDLTDLSDFMANGTLNSINYGIPFGPPESGGAAHQANEHISCEELLRCAKIVALMLLREYVEE